LWHGQNLHVNMSYAIYLFMSEKFSRESFQHFLAKARNLYGKWNLAEHAPFNEDTSYRTIQEYVIESENLPINDDFRVWVEASRMLSAEWGFDFEWYLKFETSAGRSPLGLAVQLGSLLLAMRHFEWFVFVDEDTSIKEEPTEFRSKEAAIQHIKRVMAEEFSLDFEDLKRQKILNEEGYLLLPSS
jgi:hypothetical protein